MITFPKIKIEGAEYSLRSLDIKIELSSSTQGIAVLADNWTPPNTLPTVATIVGIGEEIDVFLVDCINPLEAESGAKLILQDVLAQAKAFDGEAFSQKKDQTSLLKILESRELKVDAPGLENQTHPAIAADHLSFESIVEHAAAIVEGQYRYRNGALEIRDFSKEPSVQIEAGRIWITSDGVVADIHEALPAIGTPIVIADTEALLIEAEVNYQQGYPVRCAVRTGKPRRHIRLRPKGTTLLPATVQQLDPLFIDIDLTGDQTVSAQAMLYGLSSEDGSCQVRMPLRVGDRILAAWPNGLLCGLIPAFPLGCVPAGDFFELKAPQWRVVSDSASLSSKEIDVVTDGIDIHS